MQDICIAPVSISNNELLQRVIIELRNILQVEIKLIDLNLDLRKAYSVDRRQYYSTQLIAEAVGHTLHLNSKIVILVDFDLFIPVFTYVFGEAQLNGKHSIVSLCRLYEEFYTGRTDDELLFERTIKEILHELGHNFGLLHCSSWDCVMHASAEIEEVDIKGKVYCKACRRTLQSIFDFRVN
ncbi:MAG TPA: archaemetzincin family Zn-dependent metalloprotease [Ignavibacteriaceae bacterium]|jgi:archaemetzincin|nr:archaemetzincin family Zn-dependent metalloprotease [Ignavibacteriaceae bacterium]